MTYSIVAMHLDKRQFTKLPRSFYLRPTLVVAKDLLGKYFVRRISRNSLIGKIVEVEAYCGKGDPASHTYRGITGRNKVMFGEGGHLYVYFTYGMHFCANVVARKKGIGEAVLIRAVEPIWGIETMVKNRSKRNALKLPSGLINSTSPHSLPASEIPMRQAGEFRIPHLTNGPAKFCEAFSIRREQNGADLLDREIFITRGEPVTMRRIAAATRVGIREGKEKKWRFYLKGNAFVSKV